ncbi:MAG: hypothetical protein SynsKO_20090 [Synoicihabitans sp.]
MIAFHTSDSVRKLICIAVFGSAVVRVGADFTPEAFYLDYQFNVPTDIMTSHSRAIVHPESNVDLAAAQSAGTRVYAYISVGELGKHAPHREQALQLNLPLRGQNPIWESDLLDLRDGRWADFLVGEVAAAAVERGFGGFFLDTLDSVEYQISGTEAEEQRDAVIALIKQLKTRFPEQEIIINRGFFAISELAGVASGLMAESVFSAYDFLGNFYRPTSSAETAALIEVFDTAIASGYEIYVLDYANPSDPAAALAAANRIISEGYHAFVSTPALNGVALGPWQGSAPMVTLLSGQRVFRPGRDIAIAARVSGSPTPTLTWFKDGEAIEAAQTTNLVLADVKASDSGHYTLRASNRFGAVESTHVQIRVDENVEPGRLSNLSTRSWSGAGEGQLIPGIVTRGEVQILARAVGPGLEGFGVAQVLENPRVSVLREVGEPLQNDDWQDDGEGGALAELAETVGAFPLQPSSKDSAIQFGVTGSATLSVGGGEGNALIEVYQIPAEASSGALLNLSTRVSLRGPADALVLGLVLAGETPRTVLLRAVGPGLSAYGVNSPLADPAVEVFSNEIVMGGNDNWSSDDESATQLRVAADLVGAFPLETGSSDAALQLTLPPGVYTATIKGNAEGAGGTVLAEIYLLPES